MKASASEVTTLWHYINQFIIIISEDKNNYKEQEHCYSCIAQCSIIHFEARISIKSNIKIAVELKNQLGWHCPQHSNPSCSAKIW